MKKTLCKIWLCNKLNPACFYDNLFQCAFISFGENMKGRSASQK